MAHNILDGMYAGKQSAWHKLGIVGEFENSRDAIKRGGMEFEIHKMPLYANTPDGDYVNMQTFGLVRGPTVNDPSYVGLGTCGADYDYFQNMEIADRIDMLTEQTGWKFATAGVLGKGETIFICLDAGYTTIAGDDVARFFTYCETRDGKTKSRIFNGRMRVVCSNTLEAGWGAADGRVSVRHHTAYKSDADWIMDMVAEANKRGMSMDRVLNDLATIQMDAESFTDLLSEVSPMPTMPNLLTMPNLTGPMKERQERAEYIYQMKVGKVAAIRSAIADVYSDSSDVQPDQRGTAWAAYNAVTHYTTHIAGTLAQRGRKASDKSRAESDLFGEGLAMRNAALKFFADL